jgi:hypothetical protein
MLKLLKCQINLGLGFKNMKGPPCIPLMKGLSALFSAKLELELYFSIQEMLVRHLFKLSMMLLKK